MASTRRTQPARLKNRDFMQPSAPIRLFVHTLDRHVDIHWHEFFELAFVISGEGEQILNGKPSRLSKGTLFLLTPADFHELTPAPGEPYVHYNLIFSDRALGRELHRLLFVPGRESLVCRIPDRRFGEIAAAFELIRDELDHPRRAGADMIVQGALERLLIELIRQTDAPPAPRRQEAATDQAMLNAIAYVQLHFRDALSLQDAAGQANLSPNYFSKCFRQFTGMTYQHFLQDLRLQFAASLAKISDLPITEICFAAGFRTLSHFERAFKQKFGRSPRAYRTES